MAGDAAQRLAALLGAGNLATLHAHDAIAGIQFKMRDYAAAAASWRSIVQALAHLSGRPTDFAISAQANVALALLYAGDAAEAAVAGEAALEMAAPIHTADSPRLQSIRYQLAFCRLEQGASAGVGALLDGLDPGALKQAIQAPDWEARLLYQRGRLAFLEGRREEAVTLLEQAERGLVQHGSKGLVSPPVVRLWLARTREWVQASLKA